MAIPAAIDAATIQLVELDSDLYFYRLPVPDRKEGANMIQFTVDSFPVFLKIDQRRNGSILPVECWLRSRTQRAFLAEPEQMFEEGRTRRSLGASSSARRLFGVMRTYRSNRA